MGKKNLAQDGKGNYRRDLGFKADGKQPRFYLGRDEAQAEKRPMKLERLWELVEARWQEFRQRHAFLEEKWQQEVERGEWQDDMATLEEIRARWQQRLERPCWDAVTRAIADAIRQGESVCVLGGARPIPGRADALVLRADSASALHSLRRGRPRRVRPASQRAGHRRGIPSGRHSPPRRPGGRDPRGRGDFRRLGLVPFLINPHHLEGHVFLKAGENLQEHFGETRDERIREFHELNDPSVVGLREAGVLDVADGQVTLRGARARVFRKGQPPVDVEPDGRIDTILES